MKKYLSSRSCQKVESGLFDVLAGILIGCGVRVFCGGWRTSHNQFLDGVTTVHSVGTSTWSK